MYAKFWKRVLDLFLSVSAILVLSPLLLLLTVIGAIAMRGNPFFTQQRPGRISKKTGQERIFRLIKFRTMTNQRDAEGNLLPNELRMTKYGNFLRRTSLDELPELLNIAAGQMAIVGPRPLLVRYLPLYSEEQRHRHDVRPGLTGYAQAHGRNGISWEEKFEMDVWYTKNVTFATDVKIILDTVKTVLKHEGINASDSVTMTEFTGTKNSTEERK